jgi:16S rRNA (cytidine1402-2'-O)-methyltransferase
MLYLVSTPIGNLGDITLRALETLKSVDMVVSEDTRKTGFLLKHFEIKKPQISFHDYNEARVLQRIMDLLRSEKNVALVSDAGSPSISDPGYVLVRAALQEGIPITSIPGASAPVTALILSGLPVHSFTFRGFPPRKSAARRRFLAVDGESPHTLIFFESPYRLVDFLKDALAVYGDRPAAVANDLTKMFEAVLRGTLSELVQRLEGSKLLGEYTVVISGKPAPAKGSSRHAREEDPGEEDA